MPNDRKKETEFPKDKTKLKHIAEIILQTSIDGFCAVSLEGKILEVNQALCDIIGYSKEELLKMKITDIEALETAEQTAQHIDKTIKQGHDCFETQHKHKSGKILDIEVSTQFCDFGEDKFFYSFFSDITERKVVKKALREGEERLRVALSAAQMGTWRWDPTTNQDTRDASFNGILGLEAVESTQPVEDFLQRVHPEDRDMVDGEIQRSLREHCTYVAEFRIIQPDGTVRWLRDQGKPVYDENDHILYLTGAVVGITNRKMAEKALRESEEKFRNLVENIPDWLWEVDKNGVYVYASPKVRDMLGYTPEEIIGKTPFDLMPETEAEKIRKCFEEKLAEKQVFYGLENINCHKDGHLVVLETSGIPLLDEQGQLTGYRGIDRDISERKKAEKQLRESERRHKTLFQGAAEGIFVIDVKTKKFKYANPAICKMLGYTEEEIIGMGVRDIHPKEKLEYVFSEFEAHARDKIILLSDIPCLRKDGTIIYADIKTANMMIDSRECSIGFFTDITERKRIRTNLENYKEQVLKAQRHAYIGSVGAIVAHQVNQPLTKINILLDRAIEQIEEASCCPSALKNVKEGLAEAKEAASIIQKFSQYFKGRALEGTDKVNVIAVADRIASVLSKRAKQAKIHISIKDLTGLPEIETNETALEQIFLNIIQNAIEAADGQKSHKLDITGKFADDNIELQFADDCCGIALENTDRIFEPFFSTKTEDQGMGIGLDIVQQILINFSGQIRVESRPGKGTTFYVTLPISSALKP
ncbi:PAS domain S-box protein [Planctomycetota bacterium]